MKRLAVAVIVGSVVVLATASAATAFEGGGREPSMAPVISWGQHYTGQLNNHKSEANFSHEGEVAFWRLPPVSTRDQVVINWQALPYTGNRGGFPVYMILVQGVDDFSWGERFNGATEYEFSDAVNELSGSGSSRTVLTVQDADASSTYLEFFSGADVSNPEDFETYPYDFTVEAPRHFLGLAITPKKKVHANGAIWAAATLADGSPVPDGLVFDLKVEWEGGGVATSTAASVGGRLAFPLSLPESAWRKRGSFLVSRGEDATYQGALQKTAARITPPTASAAELACTKARRRAHVLARQLKRLKRHAARARGRRKRYLRHRAHKVGRKFRRARKHASAVCSQA